MAHPRATHHHATRPTASALDILVDVAVARAQNERAASSAPISTPANPRYPRAAHSLPPPHALAPPHFPRAHTGPSSLPARLAPLPPPPPSRSRGPALPPPRALLHPPPPRRARALPPLSRVASAPSLAPPALRATAQPPPPPRAVPIPVPRSRDRADTGSSASSPARSVGSMPRELAGSAPRAKLRRRESYTRFTPEEEQMLLEGVAVYGAGNWKKILNSYRFHWKRTAVDLKDKYRNMTRARMRRAAAAAAASESSDMSGSPSAAFAVPLSPLSAPPVGADTLSHAAYLHANGHRGRPASSYHHHHRGAPL